MNTSAAETTRTDEHITALTAEIARLRAESSSPLLPGPIRQRLAGRAAALEKIAERHARTRITQETMMPADERREIEAAMGRLLNGTPVRSDGKLTIVSLAAEAGVKRHALTTSTPTSKTSSMPASRRSTRSPPARPHCASRTMNCAANSTTRTPNATSTSRPPTRSPAPSTS